MGSTRVYLAGAKITRSSLRPFRLMATYRKKTRKSNTLDPWDEPSRSSKATNRPTNGGYDIKTR
jgi:hypothetical protein